MPYHGQLKERFFDIPAEFHYKISLFLIERKEENMFKIKFYFQIQYYSAADKTN